MRKLKYFVACSVDRFIAAADGSFDFFLQSGPHIDWQVRELPETLSVHARNALGITAGNQMFDTVLMGYRTYKVGLDAAVASPYAHLKQYVFSKSLGQSPHPDVTLVSGDALEAVRRIKSGTGMDIWLCGGGELASALAPEIDELMLKVHPVLAGSGIPLFARTISQTPLELLETWPLKNGFVFSRYAMRPAR